MRCSRLLTHDESVDSLVIVALKSSFKHSKLQISLADYTMHVERRSSTLSKSSEWTKCFISPTFRFHDENTKKII